MLQSGTIDAFQGPYFFLSNFYPHSMKAGKVVYPTLEHAFQAHKSKSVAIRKTIANKLTPQEAKKAGQNILLREDWEDVKIDVMRKLLRIKFGDPFMAGMLCGTGYNTLIEGNWWGDKFWGVHKGTGRNELGKLLMELRSVLQAEYMET